MSREYKCVVCKGTFESDLTDGETEEQLNEEFPGYTKEECDQVCDDCYKVMMKAGVFKDE